MTKPVPIALVVCDDIYRDPGGKTALVGLFNCIRAAALPVVHPRLSIYASVTDVHAGTVFRVRLEHSESGKVVAELNGRPPDQTDPTTICDFMFLLQGLQFTEAGRYYIQFWGNDSLLMQRPFDVQIAKPAEPGPNPAS